MTDSTSPSFDSWTSPFEDPGMRPTSAPSSANAAAPTPAPDTQDDLDLSVLSVPQLPMFTVGRHGIGLADIQEWYKNTLVPRFLEILELVKKQRRQMTALATEQHQAQTTLARNEGELQVLRQQVRDLTAQVQATNVSSDATHRVLERAQVLADQLVADAEAESAVTLEAAHAEAARIRQTAESEAQTLIGDARKLYDNHQAIIDRIQVSSQQAVQMFRTLADQLERSAQDLAHDDPFHHPSSSQ